MREWEEEEVEEEEGGKCEERTACQLFGGGEGRGILLTYGGLVNWWIKTG